MTKQEFDGMAALVVRLRKDVELHTDALRQSNAHCGKLLVQNEQLHSELVKVRSSLASVSAERDSLKRTLDEWSNAETKPHARVAADDIADHVVPPVLPMCNVCHGCGGMLIVASNSVGCYNVGCRRTMTVPFREATVSPFHPYYGPCATDGACSHG